MTETKPIIELKEWDKNPRNIDESSYLRLKKQIILLGQYKPLLITRENVVLGGNMRLKVLKELVSLSPTDLQNFIYNNILDSQGNPLSVSIEACTALIEKFKNVEVRVIDFVNDESSGVHAVLDGVNQVKTFPTIEEAMAEYALSDNDRAGYYNEDDIANMFGNLQIDPSLFSADLTPPKSIEELLTPEPATGENNSEGQELKSEFQVVVECKNEIEQQEVYQKLVDLGLICKVLTL